MKKKIETKEFEAVLKKDTYIIRTTGFRPMVVAKVDYSITKFKIDASTNERCKQLFGIITKCIKQFKV